MAKNKRYRWQNERRALQRSDDERFAAEKRLAKAQRQKNRRTKAAARNGWGSKLQFYELVSLHPLKYKKVR